MTQLSIWNIIEDVDLSGYTLVVPSVAVGNVAQLTCDFLISSFHMKKVANIYSPANIPVLGYDPYDLNSSVLSTSCELYRCEAKKMLVLQIRSPLILKYARSFLTETVETLRKKNVKDMVILSSSYAHEKKHILTSPFRYKVNQFCPYKKTVKDLNWTEHESTEGLNIFGGGFASLLFEITTENSLPCLLLYKYCSEGDNIPDAYDMVQQLSNVIQLFSETMDLQSQLIQPVSWKYLFGKPPPGDIY